jgi:hypothetical protein
MLFKRLRAVWHPDRFQGWGRNRRYFEGWYFKLVSADERHALAFIPGISMDEAGQKHAFVQVMDGKACTAAYHRFPAAEFLPASHTFELDLGGNHFSPNALRLNLPDAQGEIRFADTQPWPKMLGAPGIMGWYSFVPFMECNHGVVSLNHSLEGGLNFGGSWVDFTGGKGYIEKDWGRSFPRAYIWAQSNHFGTTNASMMASVAHIPWLGSHFIGFICGFWLEGRLFKFATYTGAKKHVRIAGNTVEIVFKNPSSEIRIQAEQAAETALVSPLSGEMRGKVQESLQATVQVELLAQGKRVFEGTGRNAGLELAGKLEVLG